MEAFRGTRGRVGKRAPPIGLIRKCHRRLKEGRRWVFGSVAAVAVWGISKVPYPLLRAFCRWIVAPGLRLRFGAQARSNLQAVLGHKLDEAQITTILRDMFRGVAMLAAEIAGCLGQGPEFFFSRVDDTEARDKLRAFEAAWPGGFLTVSGHVGNWEILAIWIAKVTRNGLGGPLAKRNSNHRLNRVIEGVRKRLGLGIEPIYQDQHLSKVVHLLRNNKIIGLLPDQDVFRAEGVFVDFMGRPAYTPLGPARLAWTAKVPICVIICKREANGRFKMIVNDPIYPDRSRPKGQELARLTREWSRILEEFILAHPEQWAWFHDRWKTTPEKLRAQGRTRLAFEA